MVLEHGKIIIYNDIIQKYNQSLNPTQHQQDSPLVCPVPKQIYVSSLIISLSLLPLLFYFFYSLSLSLKDSTCSHFILKKKREIQLKLCSLYSFHDHLGLPFSL